jgi:hypothetical protein
LRVQLSPIPLIGRGVIALVLLFSLAGFVVSLDAHPAGAMTQGDLIVTEAASQSNVPYCDDGGGIHGPTYGGVNEPGCDPSQKGFDCMSLVQFAVFQAMGIALPGDGSQLTGVGQFIPPAATIAQDTAQLLPGDVVFWGGTLGNFEHSGVYAGNGEVWDALKIQVPVQEHTMSELSTIYSYDGAIRYWNASAPLTPGGLAAPVVGMAATPDGSGYWLANAAGAVSAHGSAVSYGSMAGQALRAPITHIVSTPDGKGYWLVATDGGIFTFGDAGFFSSMGGQPLNKPVVGIAADFQTGGYWEVASDGGIFSFNAPFYGSTGNLVLNKPVNGMTATPDDKGYLFVASDGGVFAFGDAKFQGSMGATALNSPVVGLAANNATGGYWMVGGDGGIFSFNAPFYGAD